jgi:hypothetical protein
MMYIVTLQIRYSIDTRGGRDILLNWMKDEWRRFATPTCPGPRSAHATVAAPMGGGKLFLFGKPELSILE